MVEQRPNMRRGRTGDTLAWDTRYWSVELWQVYQVDHGWGEEDGEPANNLAESDSLSSDDSGEDLTAVLETNEVGGIDHHPPDEADTEDGERPLGGDEPVHDASQAGCGKKYQ